MNAQGQNAPIVSVSAFVLVRATMLLAASSSIGTTCWCRSWLARATVFGIANCVVTLPALGRWSTSRSGLTNNRHPATPCGRIDDSGPDAVLKPSTDSASEIAGIPVATAVNVEPVHGSDVAVKTLGPALPVQLAPNEAVEAGQVVVSCAT